MHDLVVADRQGELLAERVHEREGDLVVVVAPVRRVALDVLQGVVHPAHVPLLAEPEPARAGRLRDARPRGALLGDHHDARVALVRGRVRLLQERDRLEVLASAVDVRQPLGARVVEVQHRGDGVHAKPVDVELLEPVERVRDEEVADLRLSEVEHVRAPVELLATAGVRVLEQRVAVELRQGPLVLREVPGDPVHDHADAGGVQPVDEVPEVVGGAEPGSRGVVARDLVAPRSAEGVLGERQELHVGEARVLDVADELVGDLAVGQPRTPRTEVDLVDAHRTVVRGRPCPVLHPLRVAVGPLVVRLVDHGGGQRRDLGPPGERVGPLHPAGVGEELELVPLTDEGAGPEQLPDTEVGQATHRGGAAFPALEVTDHPGCGRPRGPERERDAVHAVDRGDVRAEVVPQLLVTALAEEVQVELADRRGEPVRVVGRPGDVVAVGRRVRVVVGLDPVPSELAGGRAGPEAVALVRELDVVAVRSDDPHGGREVADHPDARAAVDGVRSEDVVGLGPAGLGDLLAEPLLDGGGTRAGRLRRSVGRTGGAGRPRLARRGERAAAFAGRRVRPVAGAVRVARVGRRRDAGRASCAVTGGRGPLDGLDGLDRLDRDVPRVGRVGRVSGERGRFGDVAVRRFPSGRGCTGQVLAGRRDSRLVAGGRGLRGGGRTRSSGCRRLRRDVLCRVRRARGVGRHAAGQLGRRGRRHRRNARPLPAVVRRCRRCVVLGVGVGHRWGPSTTSRCTGSWNASRRT
ncbi:hypothetical protein QE359_003026 [Curtobacterium sp. SORGH_AS776]|nr:hypothetical protein [Curtobacterium sp. SORGH_AS_0776]